MIGKTLDEAVREMDDNEIIHIGSASGFVYIGTKQQYDQMIDSISDRYHNFFKDAKKRYTRKIKKYSEKLKALDEESETYEKEYRMITECVQRYKRYLKQVCGVIDRFKPMRERMVKEIYKRISKDGIVITIQGDETGKYWSKDEWDRGHKGGEFV